MTDVSHNSAQTANKGLPLFYKSMVPLLISQHHDAAFIESSNYEFAAHASGIPLVLDEVAVAQRHYPIVFSAGAEPVPMALTGLPEGGNRFLDGQGRWKPGAYIPAYVRRYPFVLAKLDPKSDALSVCFDPSSERMDVLSGRGNLFHGGKPTQIALNVKQFCEQFEVAAQRTRRTMQELLRMGVLIDGQADVRRGQEVAASLRGFQVVSEERLLALSGDAAAGLMKAGGMALVYAHFFSIHHIVELLGPDKGQAGA